MNKELKRILDQIILGFWIAFGVTLFQILYDFGLRAIKKIGAFIITV